MFVLFRCLAEVLAQKGLRGLLGEVPFAGLLVELAFEAHERWCRRCGEPQRRAELEQIAQAPADEVRRQADLAADLPLELISPAAKEAISAYLAQVPAAVRRSCRRLDDPAGATLPPGLPLRRPDDLLRLLPTRPTRFRAGDRALGGVWELEELLGVGGFGEVWRARHPRLKNIPPVALKFCLDEDTAASLRHEADLLDQVMGHGLAPGVVALRNAYLDADPVCLEYEYVEGGDLTALAASWPADQRSARAAEVIARLSAIVGRMHRLGPPVVHRDLKPSNVLVRRGDGAPELLVADFGISAIAARREVEADREATSGDMLPTLLRGAYTPLYASPQQRDGLPPDVRDDVYALGVVWYQLVVGDFARRVGPDYAEDLREQHVPEDAIALLGACVAVRADRRPADAAVLAEKLGRADPPRQAGELVVGRFGPCDYRSIGEALRAASPHARIRVRPGTYSESVNLDRPVEIIGDGPRAEILIESSGGPCLMMDTDEATVRGLTIRCRAEAERHFAVEIAHGRLVLEDCEIASESAACVGAHGSAARAVVRRCAVRGGAAGGVFVFDQAEAVLEECEVFDNATAGVEARDGGSATLSRCVVRDGRGSGVLVGAEGRAVLEDCEVRGNALAGLEIRRGGSPVARRCRFEGGKASGVYAHEGGTGLIERCEVRGNAGAGVTIKGGADPTFRECRIEGNGQSGAALLEQARGTFEGCTFANNERLGLSCSEGSAPVLKGCKVHGNRQGGLWVYDRAAGTFEGCELWGNAKSAVNISRGGDPVLRRCMLRDGPAGGLFVFEGGRGTLEGCELVGHGLAAVETREDGAPTLRDCRIHGGQGSGVSCHSGGRGTLERCEVSDNVSSNVVVKSKGALLLRDCKVHGGKASGVFALDGGSATLEGCDVWGNALAGVEAREGGVAKLRACQVHEGRTSGVFANVGGRAVLEGCDVFANLSAGVVACERGEAIARHCQVRDCKANGVFVYRGGRGLFEHCQITGNDKAGIEVRENGEVVVSHCRVGRNNYEGVWAHAGGSLTVEHSDLTGNRRGPWDIAAAGRVVRRANREA